MDSQMREVYVGESSIVSSLGVGTQMCVDSIATYTTNVSMRGDTPICAIDRSALALALDLSLDVERLGDYTFAEQLVILAMSEVEQRSCIPIAGERTAVILSTTKGNVELLNEDFDRTYLWQFAENIKSYFRCEQRPQVISTACISGVAAIAVGARMVECGEVDNVYVVGVDSICDFIVEGFNSFKSISPEVCRPYDSARNGLTIGEGCGVMLLCADEKDSASKLASKIVVSGCGLSNDANHISAPSRSGDGLFFAIEQAMKQGGVTTSDIDYINLHGTGTPYNDEMESKAVNMAKLLSSPCNSLKPYLGHTFGASGVIESILVVEQMVRGEIFGVKGYESCGVPFELNLSAEHRKVDIRHALKTASGFGGTNGAILFSQRSCLKMVHHNLTTEEEMEVEQIAHIEMDSSDNTETPFAEFIKSEYRALEDANLKFFKMDSLSKLGYVASCRMMKGVDLDVAPNRIAIVMANRSSSSQSDLKHQAIVDERLAEGASPAVFVYTLPNIVASQIAIKHRFQGETIFFVEEEKSMAKLKKYGEALMARGVCDAVMYGWCEEFEESYNVELTLIKIK